MHSAAWDQKYNFECKTVAVVGGGSSAVQIVPQIQKGEFSVRDGSEGELERATGLTFW